MRNRKTFSIEGVGEVTVLELRVRDIRTIISAAKNLDDPADLLEHLPLLTDLKAEAVDDMAPSELGQVFEQVREVNAPFFTRLKEMGVMEEVMAVMRQSIAESMEEQHETSTE